MNLSASGEAKRYSAHEKPVTQTPLHVVFSAYLKNRLPPSFQFCDELAAYAAAETDYIKFFMFISMLDRREK
jgi:hypothetical protein